MTKTTALLRYFSHFTLDVKSLSDEEYIEAAEQLFYALKQTGQMDSK